MAPPFVLSGTNLDPRISPVRKPRAIAAGLRIFAVRPGAANQCIAYSDDGDNWALATSPADLFSCMAYSPELGYLIAISTTAKVYQSIDRGETWTNLGANIPAGTWQDVIWVSDLGSFIAVAADSNIALSNEGFSWTPATSFTPSAFSRVVYRPQSGNLFVGRTGNMNNAALKSTDGGYNWSPVPAQAFSWGIYELIVTADGYLVGGNRQDNGSSVSTDDGVVWTRKTNPTFGLGGQTMMCEGPDRVLTSTDQGIQMNPDGNSDWVLVETGAAFRLIEDMVFADSIGYVGVQGSDVLRSQTGATWSALPMGLGGLTAWVRVYAFTL